MRNTTVFVIGAGASKEARLPTGNELKKEIASLLDLHYDFSNRPKRGDHIIGDALHKHANGGIINPYFDAALHIRDALPQAISIDNFIDAHRGNGMIELCGKLAIVRSILMAEKRSLFHFQKERADSSIDFSSLDKTWYIPFFQLLTENCTVEDLEKRFQSIKLIIFNYDRCIEHYLFHALRNYYRIHDELANKLIQQIQIFHPYGHVGYLQWKSLQETMEFGATPNSQQLLDLSERIKTFTEGTDPESSELVGIRRSLAKAHKVVFLGFAFHKLNMKLLEPNFAHDNEAKAILKDCYATTFNISESDKNVIKSQIEDLFDGVANVNMANLSCHNFFSEYWRSLSF